MGKINKYSNLYNKQGEILRKVDKGVLKNMTTDELSALIKTLRNDENVDKKSLSNAESVLFNMGLDQLREYVIKSKNNRDSVTEKLLEVDKELEESKKVYDVNTNDDEYVEYKESA